MEIFIEVGKKKVFVGAAEWAGWCRFGRDEPTALDAFLAYGERYAMVLENTNSGFIALQGSLEMSIVERHEGTVSTDFGAPAAVLGADQAPMDSAERGELPVQGPRGGVIWPPRYFVRRVAWHVLDHAW